LTQLHTLPGNLDKNLRAIMNAVKPEHQ
jgi:hypothetical protein